MANPSLDLIDKFFEAYGKRDLEALRRVVAENVKWIYPGPPPLGGTKVGVDQVVAFFDAMGNIMGRSNPQVDRLVIGANEHYVVECQHVKTNRAEGNNLDIDLCVLWKMENGKIVEGKHMTDDQPALYAFFARV
jgi:uncharacterized protein